MTAARIAAAGRARRLMLGALLLAGSTLVISAPLFVASSPVAIAQDTNKKPYDKQLLRLSELLGAVHYLRELCGANDGMLWRNQMQALMKAEGTSALRRLNLTRKFNFGYHSYSRTYHRCTPSAQTAITRFINEAAVISDNLIHSIK